MFKETSHAHIEQLVRKHGFHIALDSLLEETERKPSEVADLHHEVSICVCLYRSVPLIRPPHFVHYIQPKVGGGLIFEYAISLKYKPPLQKFYAIAT